MDVILQTGERALLAWSYTGLGQIFMTIIIWARELICIIHGSLYHHMLAVLYTPPHNPSGLCSDSLGHSDNPRTLLGLFRVVMLYTILTAFSS